MLYKCFLFSQIYYTIVKKFMGKRTDPLVWHPVEERSALNSLHSFPADHYTGDGDCTRHTDQLPGWWLPSLWRTELYF